MKKLFLNLILLLIFSSAYTQVYFTADIDQGCSPLSVLFTNETHLAIDTTNMVFHWSFNDGIQDTGYHSIHTFNQPGRYTVYAYADSMGKYIGGHTLEISVEGFSGSFYPEDSAYFCPGESIGFHAQDNYTSLRWYFDGKDNGNENSNWVNHSFDSVGYHSVKLWIEHNCGIDSVTQIIVIDSSAAPDPSIYVNQDRACPNDQISFNAGIAGETFTWKFGDGATSLLPNPKHMYADTGSYLASVAVINSCGNAGHDTVLIDINTNVNVFAYFNWWGSSCPNTTINFNTGSAGTYMWDFDNGQMGSQMEETTTYQDTGMYHVSLIVTNGCGRSDTTTRDIDIRFDPGNKPNVAINLRDNDYNYVDTLIVCPNTGVQLENSYGGDNNTLFTWYFGDGDTLSSTERNVNHEFTQIGTNEVLLVGRNGCGGIDTARKWIIVSDTLSPDADLQVLPPVICPGEFVYFYDENNDESNRYSIWFGDGFYLLDVGPENDSIVPVTARHQYFNIGSYAYTFSVTNTCGNTHSLKDTIYVSDTLGESFLMAFSETDPAPNRRACPDDIIEFYGVGGTSVTWDFGGGVYDTNIIGKHSYPAVGDYTAHAIFTTGCGEIDTVEVMAYVGDDNKPDNYFQIHFNGNFPCVGDTIEFDYRGGGDEDEDENLSYKWYFGNGDSSMVRNPVYIYDTIGNFNVELMVTNGCGTSHRMEQLLIGGIFIDDAAIALSDPDCGSANGSITGLSTFGSNRASAAWMNANHDIIGSNLDISSLGAGAYTLMVMSTQGCKAMSEVYQLENKGAPVAPLAPSPAPYCMNDAMSELVATPQSAGTIKWYGDPGLSSLLNTGTNFNPGAMESIKYYVTETSGSCESPATVVNVVFNSLYVFKDTFNLCQGDRFYAAGDWRTEPGTFTDSLTSTKGCDSIRITTLKFKPISRHNITAQICNGDAYYVQGEWQTKAGVYFDTLLAANGCDSIVETDLTLLPTYNHEVNTFICNGDSIYLEGAWRKTSGVFSDLFVSVQNCDSLVETALTVGDVHIASVYRTICEGDSVNFAGKWFEDQGNYRDTLVSGTSCDSINELVLTVGEHYNVPVSASICENDSVKLGGQWRKTEGTYYDTLITQLGCDSVIVTTLSIINTTISPVSKTICIGDSIYLEGAWRKTAGVYSDKYVSSSNCDSIVTTTLSLVEYMNYGNRDASICTGDSMLIGSVWRNTAGNYTDTLAGPLCDSIFNVALTLIPDGSSTVNEQLCEGDSIKIGDTWVKTAGTYTKTLTGASGCDSVVTVIVTLTTCQTNTNNLSIQDWSVYPNPSSGLFTIRIDKVDNREMKVYNSSGKMVHKSTVQTTIHQVDLSNLPDGLYLVQYRNIVREIMLSK